MRFNEPYAKTRFKNFSLLFIILEQIINKTRLNNHKKAEIIENLKYQFLAFEYELDLNEKQRHYIKELQKQISQHKTKRKAKKHKSTALKNPPLFRVIEKLGK